MLYICALFVGKNGKNIKEILYGGGEMDFKKIPIDKNSYIKLYENDSFEIHCSASGPLGANVFYFERGMLKWHQRRSYSFVSKKHKIKYE